MAASPVVHGGAGHNARNVRSRSTRERCPMTRPTQLVLLFAGAFGALMVGASFGSAQQVPAAAQPAPSRRPRPPLRHRPPPLRHRPPPLRHRPPPLRHRPPPPRSRPPPPR